MEVAHAYSCDEKTGSQELDGWRLIDTKSGEEERDLKVVAHQALLERLEWEAVLLG